MSDSSLEASHVPLVPNYVPYTVLGKLEEKLEHYLLRNSPYHFPMHRRARGVAWVPWVALAGVPLALFSVALSVGLAALSTLTGSAMGLVHLAFAVATAAFGFMALPGLFSRSRKGWSFLLYECLAVAAPDIAAFDLFGIATMTFAVWCVFQLKYEYA